MQLAALQASLDVYFDERARAQLCDTTHGRHSCGLILMRPPRPGCSQTLCLCNADTVTMAYRFGFGAEPKALQRWWSVNKVAREAKLKAAHTPLEEGAAAASSHTPARFQDPAASPSTTRVGATTTTDATGEEHRPRPQPERLGGALSRGTHQHDVSSAAVPSLWDTTAVHARGGRPPRGRCGRRREHATTMEMMALVGRGACAEPCGMWYSRAPVHWLRRDGAVR